MDPSKPLVFRPVPLDARWTIPSTKLDLKAIYRRPRRKVGEFDEIIQEIGEDGLPLWDLTAPLPLRRHTDWVSKGFEYVTLADMESLRMASGSLAENGKNWSEYICHPHLGPWNPKLYLATAATSDRKTYSDLVALVEQFGIEAVEQIRNQPLPAALKAQIRATIERQNDAAAGVVTTVGHSAVTGNQSSMTVAAERSADALGAPRKAATRKKAAKRKPVPAEVPA